VLRRAAPLALVLLALALPPAGAEQAQCQFTSSGHVFTADGVVVDQATHSCSGATGSQSLDRYWVNVTVGQQTYHGAYWTETDHGSWDPAWCMMGGGECSSTSLMLENRGVETRYAQSNDGGSCYYAVLVYTGGGLAFLTLPVHNECFDYNSVMP
jgi:hypothetical protein